MTLICHQCDARYDAGPSADRSGTDNHRCPRCQSEARAPEEGADRLVIVAMPPGPFRDLLCAILGKNKIPLRITADGEQALGWVRDLEPTALFAGVFLRRMLGITLSERIRADSGLRKTRLALVGRALRSDGSAPGPESLFGAECYLQDDLGPEKLRDLALGFLAFPDQEFDPIQPEPAIVTETPVPADTVLDEKMAGEIRKLGRVAASDLFLYYPSQVIAALESKSFEKLFKDDIEQGKRLVEQRFPSIPAASDLFLNTLKEHLLRTAQQNQSG